MSARRLTRAFIVLVTLGTIAIALVVGRGVTGGSGTTHPTATARPTLLPTPTCPTNSATPGAFVCK